VDKPTAKSVPEIEKALNLGEFKQEIKFFACSVLTGVGVEAGLNWLSNAILQTNK
jgi:hypothetical protein